MWRPDCSRHLIGPKKFKISSHSQILTNKASFLCPQGCTLLLNATILFIWDLKSPLGHSIYHIKSLLGYSGPEWLYLHGFSRPLNGPFFDKNFQSKAVNEGFKDRSTDTKAWMHFYCMGMMKAPGAITTRFDVAVDGRIVLLIFGVQKSG